MCVGIAGLVPKARTVQVGQVPKKVRLYFLELIGIDHFSGHFR